MKGKKTAIFGILSALLIMSVAAIYAHGAGDDESESMPMQGMLMDIKVMDDMHEMMTANLNPEYKEQMDLMHEECENHLKSESGQGYIEGIGAKAMKTFSGMMGSGMMMGGGMMG